MKHFNVHDLHTCNEMIYSISLSTFKFIPNIHLISSIHFSKLIMHSYCAHDGDAHEIATSSTSAVD